MSNPNEIHHRQNSSDNMATSTTTTPKTATWNTEIIRQALPDCQPQEGSPANTFTDAEKEKLHSFLPNIHVRSKSLGKYQYCEVKNSDHMIDILQPFASSPSDHDDDAHGDDQPIGTSAHESYCLSSSLSSPPQEGPRLDWHGAPRFATPNLQLPRQFRQTVRGGRFTGPTNGVCPGFLQCNLVILPQGKHAFDFLLFCQRNPKACPLIEVCEPGSPRPLGVAPDADLRTDCPK